ncbi:MAG: TIGR02996 domain-containing protein [Kofleriaceae bacterium]
MARKPPPKEKPPEFWINVREPSLGTGILLHRRDGVGMYRWHRTGEERGFKEAYERLYIKPAVAVNDHVRNILKPKGPAATPKATNPELEAELATGDDNARTVYGDWLQQQNDPRGDLIAVQTELAHKRDAKLKARETELLAKHSTYFVPESLGIALKLPKRGGPRCEIAWRGGFFDHLILAKDVTPSWAEIDLVAILRDALAHPSAKVLAKITLGAPGGSPWSYLPLLAEIVNAKPAHLTELSIAETKPGEMEREWARVGDLAPVINALPALEILRVRAGTTSITKKLANPKLRSISISCGQLSSKSVAMIVDGKLPALEAIDLDTDGVELATASYAKLAKRTLHHLTIRGLHRANSLIDAMIGSPLLASLETLVLDRSDLDGAGADRIIGNHKQFDHLAKIDVIGPRIPADIATQLQQTLARTEAKTTRFALTERIVVARSPDRDSLTKARKIADPKKWLTLAWDPVRELAWGEYEGSDYYEVFVHTGRGWRAGCGCPSPRNPCKHQLALALLVATGYEFPERDRPDRIARTASQFRPTYTAGDHLDFDD